MSDCPELGEERGLVDARRIAVLGDADLDPALRRVLPAGVVACGLASAIGVGLGHYWLAAVCIPGAVAFAAAWVFASRGALRPAAGLAVIAAISLVTVSAVIGEGLADSSVLAFPVVLMFAAMTMDGVMLRSIITTTVLALLLIVGDQLFALIPYSTPPNPPWADAVIVTVIMTATMFAIAQLSASARRGLATAQIEIELRRRAEDEFRVLSTHDYLTGLFNRRFFDAEVNRLKGSRYERVSVIVADLDDLKAVNDKFGHSEGDRLMVKTAKLLLSAVRSEDVLARIGGDEFAILLPDADEALTAGVVERIEECVAVAAQDAMPPVVQISIGAATMSPERLEWTIAEADARMYESKRLRKGH